MMRNEDELYYSNTAQFTYRFLATTTTAAAEFPPKLCLMCRKSFKRLVGGSTFSKELTLHLPNTH